MARRYATDPAWQLRGLSDGGELRGVIGVSVEGGEGTIRHVAVAPDARRRGLGRRLVEAVLELGQCAAVSAETDADAVGFYRRCGFAVTSLGDGRTPGVERFRCRLERRAMVIERLADLIVAAQRRHPLRVAIDGGSGAGKSTLADELVAPLARRGRPTIRASVDDFYRLGVDHRTRAGLTAKAFYAAAYDYAALRSLLLDPLGPGGSRRYRARWHDGWHEGILAEPERTAPEDAVLLVDGVFLLRPDLADAWDVRVFVDVAPEQGLVRGVERDLAVHPVDERAARRDGRVRVYRERYLPADAAYLWAVDPLARADVVVDNRDLAAPRLRRPRRDAP